MTVVIAYDISEDRRRARAAAICQTWGDRIQKSVFLCTLEPEDLNDLGQRLRDTIDVDTDSVYVFRQCAACWDACTVIGQAHVEAPPLYWGVF